MRVLLLAFLLTAPGMIPNSAAEEGDTEQNRHWGLRGNARLLAFQRHRKGTEEIGIVDEFGESMKILTEGALHYATECWSPDGLQIAFSVGTGSVHELCVVRADGSGRRQLTELGQYTIFCDWSPTQKSLLFKTGKNDGHWSIGELLLESKKVRIIREKEPGYRCSWSPSGNYILNVQEVSEYEINREGKRIWVKRAYSADMKSLITVRTKGDGCSVAHLSAASGEGRRVLVQIEGARLSQFAFSPDGERIAFVVESAEKLQEGDLAGQDRPAEGIYVIDTKGGKPRCIVEGGFRPTWRPVPEQGSGRIHVPRAADEPRR